MSTTPHDFDDAQLQREIEAGLSEMHSDELERAMLARSHVRRAPTESGERVHGTIISIKGPDVYVDYGAKSEGVVPIDEFPPDQPPVVGQAVSLVPHGLERESGLMRLSVHETKTAASLDSLKVGDVVKARVTGSNIGGLELRVQGLRGFMPLSHVDLNRIEDFAHFVGRWLECEVVEVDRRGKRIVLSRRKLLERQREEERIQLRGTLAEGQVRRGIVRRLAPFGAFVDLGGLDGLLHVSDMSYSRINDPKEVVKEGDEIEVKILKIDHERERVSLGLKQLAADPWTFVEGKYHTGEAVEGRVTRLMDFGAFVELEPGIEGLIPISEMTWTHRIHHPKDVLKVGDHVRVSVLAVSGEKHKLSLSLKALAQDPWNGITERYPNDTIVSGAVTRLTDFGCFVQLEEGVEGLVHISQMSEQRVRTVGDVVQPGQVIQVKVLGVDAAQRRISLSIKGAHTPAEALPTEAEAAAAAVATEKKRKKKPLRGGLTW